MKKEYWFILIAYIVMQLSSIIGVPIVMFIGQLFGYSIEILQVYSVVIWIVLSFSVTLIIVLRLLRNEIKTPHTYRDAAPISTSIFWAIGGVFLALFAQGLAGNIEIWLGIEASSDNTQAIIGPIESFPIVILVSSVIGPILEEIVFRKILFGSLNKRFNFWIAALISSVIFGLVHAEIEHLLLYSAMGFTFAFLYVRTKRIIVPIFAHVAMNTMVVLFQTAYKDEIEKFIQQREQIQSFIGGFFV